MKGLFSASPSILHQQDTTFLLRLKSKSYGFQKTAKSSCTTSTDSCFQGNSKQSTTIRRQATGTVLTRTATIDAHNGPVAQMSDRRTCASIVVKEGTGANTTRTPDTETKVEGMKIDNEFSDLSNDYTIQEF